MPILIALFACAVLVMAARTGSHRYAIPVLAGAGGGRIRFGLRHGLDDVSGPFVAFAAEEMGSQRRQGGSTPERPNEERPNEDRLTHLTEAYRALTEREHSISRHVVELEERAGLGVSSQLWKLQNHGEPEQTALDDQPLRSVDLELNQALTAAYREGASEPTAQTDAVLVRIALLHWTLLLRRRSMRSFHTVVDGLIDDENCRGDMIADQLFLRYFDALFDRADRPEVEAVRALSDIARQSACLGAAQSAWLASHLYWSFVELRAFLRLNGLERLLPYVVQAAANPLLLFYDVEKYRGMQAPLSRWFAENYSILVDGLATSRLPIAWHALWLYDRRSGHLIGYRAAETVRDENEVDLALMFASLVQRENLGRFDCSLLEMIERGPTASGYRCTGSLCSDEGRDANAARRATTSVLARFAFGFGQGRRALTAAGLSADVIRETGCGETVGSGGDGGGGGGTGCGDGLNVAGRSRLSASVRCLVEQAIKSSPTRRMMRCVMEASGMCSEPAERFTKKLQESLLPGVPLGDSCQIQTDSGTDMGMNGGSDAGTEMPLTDDQASEKLDQLSKVMEMAVEKVGAAQQIIDKFREQGGQSGGTPSGTGFVTFDEYQKALKDRADAARDYNKAREDRDKLFGDQMKKHGSQQRCPPDTPECGGNDCTGMSEAARQTMRCLEQVLDPETPEGEAALNPFGPREPGVVDPSPLDDTGDPRWTQCLDYLSEVSNPTAKGCWAVDCGPSATTIALSLGSCDCDAGTAGTSGDRGRLAGHCYHIDCGGGTPIFKNGHCTCQSANIMVGSGPPPPAPMNIGNPPGFFEVRNGDLSAIDFPVL